jgi:hypothetical protein
VTKVDNQKMNINKTKHFIILTVFNPEYALDFIRKEIRQNRSEAHEQCKK